MILTGVPGTIPAASSSEASSANCSWGMMISGLSTPALICVVPFTEA